MQQCTKDKEFNKLWKSINESEKRDVLQSEQILNMQKDITEVKGDIKDVLKKLENLEQKFASKRVEWVVKGLIGLILVGFMGALGTLVFVKIS